LLNRHTTSLHPLGFSSHGIFGKAGPIIVFFMFILVIDILPIHRIKIFSLSGRRLSSLDFP